MIRAWWRPRGAALVLVFLVTLPAVSPRPHSADEIEYFSFLRSLWFDRDLSFDNEYRYFYDHGFTTDPGFKTTFIDAETATRRRPTFATIGCALLWAPFYAVADVGVRTARLAGTSVPADGFSWPYLTATAYGSAIYGALALVISAAVARRLTGVGTTAALVVLAGTPLVFYMYVMPLMAHACSAFVVAAFVWTWLRVRETWSVAGVAALAAVGALMTMVREQDAFIVVVPAVDYVWTLVASPLPVAQGIRSAAGRLAVAAGAFALSFLPQAIAYITLHGRIGPSPVVSNKMHWTAPWAAAVLFSPEHGWFFWTPLAALALAGLVTMAISTSRSMPRTSRIGVLLLLAVATQVYVSGSVATWTLAGAFGQRRFLGVTVCVTVGVAWLVARFAGRASRWVLFASMAVAVWWNLGLAVQFGEHSMDRQRLELRRNGYATFVQLPVRLPRIVYRYLFDRSSFYQSHPVVPAK